MEQELITVQPIYTSWDFITDQDIIGPDTLLYNYQKAKFFKKDIKVNEIMEISLKMGYQIAFAKDRYELYSAK